MPQETFTNSYPGTTKRLGYILWCGICLNAIEYIIVLVCIHAEDVIRYHVPITQFRGTWRAATEIILVRFIFYFALWVAGMWLLHDWINVRRPALKLAIVNCLLYVVISVLMTSFFPGAVEFFARDFFFFLIAATFTSPFILSGTPWLNEVMAKL